MTISIPEYPLCVKLGFLFIFDETPDHKSVYSRTLIIHPDGMETIFGKKHKQYIEQPQRDLNIYTILNPKHHKYLHQQ